MGKLTDGDLCRARRLAPLMQTRSWADDVEGRAAGTDELARRRREDTLLDPSDRLGELGLESRKLGSVERRADGRIGPLQELVDDLDLLDAGPEAGQRVDEPLEAVVALDQLFRRCLLEDVGLVVDDEGARAVSVKDVEAAAQENAVV